MPYDNYMYITAKHIRNHLELVEAGMNGAAVLGHSQNLELIAIYYILAV